MNWFLSSKIRKATSTSEIESHQAQLESDYKEFLSFGQSQELEEFEQLRDFVNSVEFRTSKKEINSMRYKGSSAWSKEKQFLKFQKSGKYRVYLQVLESSELKVHAMIKDSEPLKRYQELEEVVKSKGFTKKEKPQEWKEYKNLRDSSQTKEFTKFERSRRYRTYLGVSASDELSKFNSLKEYLSSDEFQLEKTFLQDKKRFMRTPEYAKYSKYKEMEASESFQNYFRWKKDDPFNELRSWELSFFDDFDTNSLDQEKWITRYYWGDHFLNDSYALPHEKYLFSGGSNISVANSVVALETRKEKVIGKVWEPSMGFRNKEFEFTSGLISTGKSFRQCFGRFEAKIRICDPQSILNNFWMLSDQMVPHVNIMHSDGALRLSVGHYWDQNEKTRSNFRKIKGIDFSRDFFIYSLEWTSEKMIWRINDVVVKVQKQGIPQESMYVILSSGISLDGSINSHHKMEVDWVRCYKRPQE